MPLALEKRRVEPESSRVELKVAVWLHLNYCIKEKSLSTAISAAQREEEVARGEADGDGDGVVRPASQLNNLRSVCSRGVKSFWVDTKCTKCYVRLEVEFGFGFGLRPLFVVIEKGQLAPA